MKRDIECDKVRIGFLVNNQESDIEMSRIENSMRNVFFGTIGNIATIVMGFILRTKFIHLLGVSYLGVNGLFTNVLTTLSLAELGIGTAINFSLYKPVADKDYEKIKVLMRFYKVVYRYIALIVSILGILLIPFLKYIIKEPGSLHLKELTVYYLIFLFNTVSSYFISYKYTLMNAEQKNYIQTNINVITVLIITFSQIAILVHFHSYLYLLLTSAGIGLIQKIFVSRYFNRYYPFLLEKNIRTLTKEEKEPIKKNVIALIYHKFGEISIRQSNNIIASSFINVAVVGFLSNYNLITTSVIGFLNIMFQSVTSSFGNLIATDNRERQYLLFRVYRFLAFWIYGFAVAALFILITPFVTLWIGKDYCLENTVILLIMLDYYFDGHRTVMNNFKTAAGVFEADKFIAIIQGGVNLAVSIVLVQFLGLKGIFIGTIISGVIANIAKPFIIYKLIFDRKAWDYFKDSLRYFSLLSGVCFVLLLFKNILLKVVTVKGFIVMMLLVVLIPNAVFFVCLCRREEFRYLQHIIMIKYKPLLNRVAGDSLYRLLKQKFRTLISQSRMDHLIRRIGGFIDSKGRNKVIVDREELSVAYALLREKTRQQLLSYSLIKEGRRRKHLVLRISNWNEIGTEDHFSWPNGLLAQALAWSYVTGKDEKDLKCMTEYYDRWIRAGAPIRTLEHVINGYSLIDIHQLTKDEKYKYSLDKIRNFIATYPSDIHGSLCYRIDKPGEISIECIGMVCPFLCRYGKVYLDPKAIDMAVCQLVNYIHYGLDTTTGLPYHGYQAEGKKKYGIIGWGRAVGWLLIGLADSLEHIERAHPQYSFLRNEFKRCVKAAVKYQRDNGYYAWQITIPGGPVDSSSTAMISYAVLRGVILGLLHPSYLRYSNLGLMAVCSAVKNGEALYSLGESMGFGLYSQEYGVYPWSQGPATALVAIALSKL